MSFGSAIHTPSVASLVESIRKAAFRAGVAARWVPPQHAPRGRMGDAPLVNGLTPKGVSDMHRA